MNLVRRVGRDIAITESDTLQIKAALVKMGKYEVPSYGITPYPDQAMIEGIRSLQSDLGVDPTGSIRPGGPEEAALTVAAEGGSASGGGTVHVHSYTQERHGNDVRVVEHTRSAPGRGTRTPTASGKIRGRDGYGDGRFGASRDGGKRRHIGVDVEALPGEEVTSPIPGTVRRIVRPYENDPSYQGVEVEAEDGRRVRIYYVKPGVKPGDKVEEGQPIGSAQDLEKRYPGITNHVHVEVRNNGKIEDPTSLINGR